MPKKRFSAEQSYYRWRKEYGGLRLEQAKHMQDLEKENGLTSFRGDNPSGLASQATDPRPDA